MRAWILAGLLVATMLAGCFGDDKDEPDDSCPEQTSTDVPTGMGANGADGGAGSEDATDEHGDASDCFVYVPPTALPPTNVTPPDDTAPEPIPRPSYPPDAEQIDIEIESVEGHLVPATIHQPAYASAERPVPMLLHSHGFAGSRSASSGAFDDYVAAGFGVISFDMRGHGDARQSSEIRVHHMDYEIQDVVAVIDYVATLDWVVLDGLGDPRLGALGGSYGGGYQLLVAAVDDRLDAMAPEITWNDLPQSLVPNDAPKSAWIDLLYGGGNANGNFGQDIHQAYAWLQLTNDVPDGQLPLEPDIVTPFTASSPKSYPDTIDIPTILIQGMPDTLFNFNEAAANYLQIRNTGTPVRLITHLNGHILSTDGTIPEPPVPLPQPIGLQPPAGPDPCGDPDQLIIDWYHTFLYGIWSLSGDNVCIALQDESTIGGAYYPLPGTVDTVLEPSGDFIVPQTLLDAARVEATVFTADEETVIAGIPRLSGSATSLAPDAIVYWTLELLSADGTLSVIDSQVTPHRVTSSGEFELELMGIGARLHPGDALVLAASNFNDQFAQNTGRIPGAVTYEGLELQVPIVHDTMDDLVVAAVGATDEG